MKLSKIQVANIEDILHVYEMAVAEDNFPKSTYGQLMKAFKNYNLVKATKSEFAKLIKIGNGGELE